MSRSPSYYEESVVAFVRAMMEQFSDVCLGAAMHEQLGGCDACSFDRAFNALPHGLRIAAIRYEPVPS